MGFDFAGFITLISRGGELCSPDLARSQYNVNPSVIYCLSVICRGELCSPVITYTRSRTRLRSRIKPHFRQTSPRETQRYPERRVSNFLEKVLKFFAIRLFLFFGFYFLRLLSLILFGLRILRVLTLIFLTLPVFPSFCRAAVCKGN